MEIKPKIISIFAGCGGSSLGYQMAGYNELLAIDFDKNCEETFNTNFPNIPFWCKDITTITSSRIFEFTGLKLGELDLLDGSPPCQGFSVAGKRKVNDKRNILFLEFIRLIRELSPKVFVMENVLGLSFGEMKGIFNEIMNEFGKLPYKTKCRMMNAKNYNVPQARKRLIWIGIRKDFGIEPVFPSPTSGNIITAGMAIKDLEESEKKNRKEITNGLRWYGEKLKLGENAAKYHKKGSLFGLRRIKRDSPCPTIIKSAGTSLLHYKYSLQFLSIRELARLTSFPDSFEFIGSRGIQIDMIGNCVPPRMMEAIARIIKEKILDGLQIEIRLVDKIKKGR